MKRFILCLAALMLLSGCSKQDKAENPTPGAKGLQSVTLKLNWLPETEHGGYYHAEVAGLYKEAGLDVKIIPGGTKSSVEKQVALGQADFGIVNADKILAVRANGLKIVGLMAPFQKSPRCIMVKKDSSYQSLADLKNMTLVANNTKPFYKFLKKTYGLEGVTTVPYGSGKALFLKEADYAMQGYINSEPLVFKKNHQVDVRSFMLADSGFNPYASVLICSEKMIKNKPELVRAMVQASRKGWQAYLQDPGQGNAALKRLNEEMDEEILAGSAAIQKGLMLDGVSLETFGTMTEKRWTELATALEACGILEAFPKDLNAAFDTQFLGDK